MLDLLVVLSSPLISQTHSKQLLKEVTDFEIYKALQGIGNDKSPGPDGFSAQFFNRSWATVGNLVTMAVKELFCLASLLKQINHMIVALIPKSSHCLAVSEFHPIACCNVIYKTISKTFAASLSSILSSFIDKTQAAFVEGRSMTYHIHLMQELLRKYNRKRISP